MAERRWDNSLYIKDFGVNLISNIISRKWQEEDYAVILFLIVRTMLL